MLKNNSYLKTILKDSVDGVDYISVINPTTELGKLLRPDYLHTFDTVFGKVISIRRVMEFLNRVDYPIKFLTKCKLTSIDIKRIRKCEIKHIKNYWTYILYATIKRVSSDPKLIELMRNNTLDYVALGNEVVKEELFNQEIEVKKHFVKLSYYVSCLRIVDKLIKDGDLENKEIINELLDTEAGGNFMEKILAVNTELV